MLTAHLRQALTLLVRVRESERLWIELERLANRHGLPERMLIALFDAAMDYVVAAEASGKAIFPGLNGK